MTWWIKAVLKAKVGGTQYYEGVPNVLYTQCSSLSSGRVLPGQQHLPQRDQDKGDDCGVQEKEDRARPHSHRRGCKGAGWEFKFLGVHITNKLTRSKHTKTVVKRVRQNLFPLRVLKRFGMGPQILKKVLQLHHREHPDWLVASLYGMATAWPPTVQGTTEGSAYGPVHHWGQVSLHPAPLYQAVSEEDPKNTPATPVIDCSLCSRTASITGVPSLVSITSTNRCPCTLTLYWCPLYIASLLLFYCCSLIICYFYILFTYLY